MADDEQKQNLLSDDSCLITNECQVDSKLPNIEASDFIYSESTTTIHDNGNDILQQALKEAETVTESVDLDEPHQVQDTIITTVVESEAQNLLNTLTGENEVHESELTKDSNDSECVSNLQTTENGFDKVSQEVPVHENEKQTVSQSIVTTTAKPPLGSSQNPIKIVLEGSKFHPSQNLTPEQFQQISQFIQGQHIEKIRESGGSSVVYNPSTNTKIIYKVVSPQEAYANKNSILTTQSGVSLLQNSNVTPASSNNTGASTPAKRGRGRPRKDGSATVSSARGKGRGRKSSSRSDEMDVGKEAPALTKEELENRKKHRPRTRSGRISKPPSYMVKEYKRIHPLDYHNNEDDIADKPDGGYSDYEVSDSDGEKSNISSNTANDESKDEIEESVKPTADVKESEPAKKPAKHRGRPPLSEAERSCKRKTKLSDAMTGCSDMEIQEVVLERLVKTLSVWDFLLKKCSDDSKINVYEVYHSFENILSNIKDHYNNHLHPVVDPPPAGEPFVEISDANVGAIFGVSTGKFSLSDQIKFKELETSSKKRPLEEDKDSDNNSRMDSKRLKLNWSGRYSASGVDLSISEVADEADATKSDEDKNYPDNVSIIKPEDMQVSIAPVQPENQVTDNIKETDNVENEVAKAENNIKFIEEIQNSDENILTNNVSASEPVSDQISNLEQHIDNTSTVVPESDHQITEISVQETADIQMEEINAQENTQTNDNSEVIQHTVNEDGEPITLLIQPETTNEEISNEQTVVGVIEETNEMGETTTVAPENILGYLGQQLSEEALQPGNIVIIQNGDGTTTTVALSCSDDKEIPMETVQALLAMDPSAHHQLQ
ncbi:hypothetical protein GQR58_007510 [Nymphon striatum]|nr:hypothetical protein GQR58_007510 [Nymphon striatum]